MVPSLSIVFMILTALICFVLPIVLFFVFRKKYGGRLVPALVGSIAFIVFALLLEQYLHSIVLRPDAAGNNVFLQSPLLYILYGTLAAGLFEETARFLSFQLLKRRYGGIGNALSYGVGHGGIEAMLLAGITAVGNLSLSLVINGGRLDAMLAPLDAVSAAQVELAASQLEHLPAYYFLLSGVERIIAITLHIALSVLVYYAVVAAGKRWLYPAAIGLHALANVPAAMMQAGVLTNLWLVEALTAAVTVLVVLLAVSVHRKNKLQNPIEPAQDPVSLQA